VNTDTTSTLLLPQGCTRFCVRFLTFGAITCAWSQHGRGCLVPKLFRGLDDLGMVWHAGHSA
jgi:hypothetical protein